MKLKNGVYYLQKRVPVDLLDKVGREMIKVSLRTKDPSEAKTRHSQKLRELDKEWEYLRSEVVTLTHKEVVALSKQRYDAFVGFHGDNPPSATETQNLIEMQDGVGHDATRLEVWYGRTADQILESNGIKVDQATRAVLLRELNRTDTQALQVVQRYAQGDYSDDPLANRFPAWAPLKVVERAPVKASLPKLFALWEKEHLVNNGATKTVLDFQHKINSLIAFLKHDDAALMTRSDIQKWCDFLRHEKGLAGKTVRDKYLAAAKAVIRIGVNHEMIFSDPSVGVVFKVPKRQKLRSSGYTDTEARTILQHAKQVFPSDTRVPINNQQAIRWLPWICAFTGARGGEIGQLRKEDLIEQDGILCLRITPEAGSVKTSNARLVPVHPQLVEEGLADFIQSCPEGHLFFDLDPVNPDPQKQASSAYKRVARWIRETVGITDKDIQPNHAWRHRFKTISRDHGLGTEYSEAIMGHEDGKASTGYGEIGPRALYREISKLPHVEVR